MDINVRSDVKQATKQLNRIQRQQVPFATALALTRTAEDVQRAEQREIKKKIDRPTPFTENAVGISIAKKKVKPFAEVFIKRIQETYLKRQLQGGVRRGQGKGLIVPGRRAKLNRFGNIPGKRKKAPLWRQGHTNNARQFVARTRQGLEGVWELTGPRSNKLRLVALFVERSRYRRRIEFVKVAMGVVNNRFVRNFEKSLAKALRTAR